MGRAGAIAALVRAQRSEPRGLLLCLQERKGGALGVPAAMSMAA